MPITIPQGFDWKAAGYLASILSVFLLGVLAWPKGDDPKWHLALLVCGMTTSIIGMACRYKAHIDEKRELKKTEAKAGRRRP